MITLLSSPLVVASALVAIPVTVILVQVVAACVGPRRQRPCAEKGSASARVAVLIPAHNESKGILPTIADVKSQLSASDRLFVVADNCTDDTAQIARAAGADVVERHDPDRRGKGFALDFGIRHISKDPPDVVVVIDADCRLTPGSLDHLSMQCAATDRPAQALDLMTAPKDCTINYQVAEFAWRIKNWVRPLGMHNLGLPCQLMGTGMAFPWKTIHSANIASGEIVEDLKLGMHLALAGQPAQFCPAACVTSQFPSTAEGAANQRQRWEQGHIGLILRLAPKTILRAILSRNGPALALALDMAVPPLALLVFLIAATCLTGTIAALLGLSTMPMLIAAASAVGLTSVLLVAWWRFGRDILPARALPQVVSYLLDKARLYARLSSRPGKATWVRTERDAPKDD